MNRHRITFALTIWTLLAGAEGAFAWRPFVTCDGENAKWPSPTVSLYPGGVSFPAGSTWNNALGYVATRWRNHPSKLRVYKQSTVSTVAFGNGRSEIWFSTDFDAPARVWPYWNKSTCRYEEIDMTFDVEEPYTTSTTLSDLWGYGGSSRPFQTTAMHEFGHVAGLGHETRYYNIMGVDWTHTHANCGQGRAYPGEDAVRGILSLYGQRADAKQELGIAHWRRTGQTSDGYSVHRRTRLFDASGNLLSLWASTPQPVYRVNKGQQVRVEMSFEQMGRSASLSPKGRVYLSTNNCISTTDTVLRSFTVSLSRDVPNALRALVTLPSNLTSGQTYWLGIHLDDPNEHDEYYESTYENASYVGIRVN